MHALRLVIGVVAVVALAGCNCGGNNKPDGGTGGGFGGGFGGGGGGIGGGGGGGGPPQIGIDQFCGASVAGYQNQTIYETIVCGMPVTANDIPHVDYIFSISGFGDFNVPFTELWAGNDCNNADAGIGEMMQRYKTAAASGRLKYDGVKALECQKAGGLSRDGGALVYPFDPVSGDLQDPCAQIWKGQVMVGGGCDYDWECVQGNYCKRPDLNSCGGGTCQALLTEGMACNQNDKCGAGTSCDTGADGGSQCVAEAGLDQPCDDNNGPFCKPGLVCFGPTGNTLCQELVALGGPCRKVPGSTNTLGTCASGDCVTTDGGANGTCTARAALGGSCGSTDDGLPKCDFCGDCDAGTCGTWGQAGADCQSDSDCFDTRFYYCDVASSRCAVRPRLNEGCVGPIADTSNDPDNVGNCMWLDTFCSHTGGGMTGTCSNLPAGGQPCAVTLDATNIAYSPNCADSSQYCMNHDGGLLGTCSDDPAHGEACGGLDGYSNSCADNADFCDLRPDAGGDGTDLGTCQAMSLADGTCLDGVECADGLFCDDRALDGGTAAMTCRALLGDGEPCTANPQCSSNKCTIPAMGSVGACTPLLDNGQACSRSSDCKSNNCDTDLGVCRVRCRDVKPAVGCNSYDLTSLSSYVFFSMVVGGVFLRRRRKDAKK